MSFSSPMMSRLPQGGKAAHRNVLRPWYSAYGTRSFW